MIYKHYIGANRTQQRTGIPVFAGFLIEGGDLHAPREGEGNGIQEELKTGSMNLLSLRQEYLRIAVRFKGTGRVFHRRGYVLRPA